MKEIELKINEFNQAAFLIQEGNNVYAELLFVFRGSRLVAYHTEVSEQLQGQGIARQLLNKLVAFARDNHFRIMVLCPYIDSIFRKNPELYNDIWDKELKPIRYDE
jgi:predicted GNAT family acetyltransferase